MAEICLIDWGKLSIECNNNNNNNFSLMISLSIECNNNNNNFSLMISLAKKQFSLCGARI